MTPLECRARIEELDRQIRSLQGDIQQIAKDHIPDFHFLDHEVSTFWTCDDSPIGMCVWKIELEKNGMYPLPKDHWCCRYCGGPVERK